MIVNNTDDFELFYNNTNNNRSNILVEYLLFSILSAILFTTRDREAATRYAGLNMINIDEINDKESRELL
jgi:hypothetical protein